MEITRTEHPEAVTFTLSGRLDTVASPKLQEAIMPEISTGKSVSLDFAGVSYVSSAGLRVLLMGEKAAKAKSARQTLTGVSASIMEVFEMTGFAAILTIVQKQA